MKPYGGHLLCVPFKADIFNLHNTGPSIRAEYKAEDPGDDIIEFIAVLGVGKGLTLCAGCIAGVYAACPYLAPRGSFVLCASGAFAA